MNVNMLGNAPNIDKIPSGLFSLDRALKGGMPLRRIYEIYGHEHIGKSTTAYYLAGKVAKTGEIDICDYEGFNPEYVRQCVNSSGFVGNVKIIDTTDKKGMRSHEEMAQELVDGLYSKVSQAGILDSVGAFIPVAEGEGDIGEAFMGQRAKRIAQFSRRAVRVLNSPSIPASAIFVINHMHQILGSRGHTTAGGETLKFLAGVRLWLYNREAIEVADGDEKKVIAYAIGGTVEKLKDGGKGGKFQIINIPGLGISPDMSALYDCLVYKMATREIAGVKIQGKSVARLSKMVEYAIKGDHAKFEPFFELLEAKNESEEPVDDDVEEE